MSFTPATPSGPPSYQDTQIAEQGFAQQAQQAQAQAQQAQAFHLQQAQQAAYQQQQQQAYQQQQQFNFQFNQPLPPAPGSVPQPFPGVNPSPTPYGHPSSYAAPPATGVHPFGYPNLSAPNPAYAAPLPPSSTSASSGFSSSAGSCPTHTLFSPSCQACNTPGSQGPAPSRNGVGGGGSLSSSMNIPMSSADDDVWGEPSASDPSRSSNPAFSAQIVDPTAAALPTTYPAYPKNPPSSSSSSSAPRKAADICICSNCNKPKKTSFDYCSKECGNRTCNHRSSASSTSPSSSSAPSGPGDVARKQALLEKATPPTVAFFRQFQGSKIPKKIEFYEKSAAFYEFTNFHEDYPIIICSSQWRTSEHFFQASKFAAYPEKMDEVRRLPSPRDAFNYVRERSNIPFIRSDWQSVKDGVMLMALRAKFSQNEKLAAILLATENAKLIEHTTNDNYWADGGGKGKGENKLGQLLMQVREELRPSVVPPPS